MEMSHIEFQNLVLSLSHSYIGSYHQRKLGDVPDSLEEDVLGSLETEDILDNINAGFHSFYFE